MITQNHQELVQHTQKKKIEITKKKHKLGVEWKNCVYFPKGEFDCKHRNRKEINYGNWFQGKGDPRRKIFKGVPCINFFYGGRRCDSLGNDDVFSISTLDNIIT